MPPPVSLCQTTSAALTSTPCIDGKNSRNENATERLSSISFMLEICELEIKLNVNGQQLQVHSYHEGTFVAPIDRT